MFFGVMTGCTPPGKIHSPRYCSVFLCLLLCLFATFAEAQEGRRKPALDNEYLDTIILMDSSGSMLRTDPQRLRDEGVGQYTGYLDSGDRIAVISFAENAVIEKPLEAYEPDKAKEIVETLRSIKADGEYTDILNGLNKAKSLMLSELRPLTERTIVLISDGKMDPPAARGAPAALTDKVFRDVIPALVENEVLIHTIALGEQSDRLLLERIANETGGSFWYADNASKIHDGIAELFADAENTAGRKHSKKGFRVDGEIPEGTFYVNAGEEADVALVSPDGMQFTRNAPGELRWFKGKQFDVITVSRPKPGIWQVLGLPKNQGFATLLTNLKLVTSFPPVLEAGEKVLIQARLYDSRIPVVLPRMTGVIRYSSTITPTDRVSEPIIRETLNDDGNQGDLTRDDGIFTVTIALEEPGEYRLETNASAPTFERRQVISFRVKPRLVEVSVVQGSESYLARKMMEESEGGVLELPPAFIRVALSAEASTAKKQKVTLLAEQEGGRRFSIPLEKVSGIYEAPIYALPGPGTYTLKAVYLGEGKKRRKLRGESLLFTYLNEFSASGDYQIVQATKNEPEVSTPFQIPWWAYALLVTVINAGAGYAGHSKLKELQSESDSPSSGPTTEPLDSLRELYATLQGKAGSTEVDLQAPMFTDPAFEPVLIEDLDTFKFAEEEIDETDAGEDDSASGEDEGDEPEEDEDEEI